MLVIKMVLLDELLYDVFVPKDGELLLQRGLLLLSNVKFNEWSVNVLHNFEEVEWESDVDPRTTYEFGQWVLIESLYEVVKEYLVKMGRGLVSLAELVSSHIK